MGWIGAVGCVVILARWHSAHSRHQRPTSADMPFHTNLADINRLVALILGWASVWIAKKTLLCQVTGTNGRRRPVETSHHSFVGPLGKFVAVGMCC